MHSRQVGLSSDWSDIAGYTVPDNQCMHVCMFSVCLSPHTTIFETNRLLESPFNLRDFKIKIKESDIRTVAMIRELQDAMQDDAVINVLSKREMDDILYSNCCE